MSDSYEKVTNDYLHINSCSVDIFNKKNDYTYRENGRVDYQIIYIHSGICHLVLNGELTLVKEGNIIVFLPNEHQEYTYKKSDSTVACCVHFTGKECKRLLSDFVKDDKRVFYVGVNMAIKNLYRNISLEKSIKEEGYNDLCVGYFLQLLTLFKRNYLVSGAQKNPIITEACLYMLKTFNQSMSVSDYAKHFNLSVSRFGHLFKESIGQTPLYYINTLRINKAKSYLTHTNLTISEVADAVGFSSLNYFSRIFKKRVGMTPSEYALR